MPKRSRVSAARPRSRSSAPAASIDSPIASCTTWPRRWAAWLAAEGIAPGDRCAILAHNDAHWCAAYLGILKRGAVAVPLDTNYSAAQVATILRDSGATLLFVSEQA